MAARGPLSFARKAAATPSIFEFSGTNATAAGPAVMADDTPRRKFVKDIMRVGEYVNGGEHIAITEADLDQWVTESMAFIAAGNDIPIPDGHTDEATANRGYVRELYRDGNTLYMVAEMIGADAIATATRSKVSINTAVDYVDGKGNRYAHLITHVALTNAPVVTDQNGFVPIAASRGGKPTRARLFRLALATTNTETTMEALTKIATMLGVEGIDTLDEAGLAAAIAKAIEAMQGMSKAATDEATTAKTELATVRASLSKRAEPDPVLVRIASKNRHLELANLVAAGNITPATRDDLAAIWIGKDGAGLKMSLDPVGDGQFSAMVEALAKNDPIKLGEQTRAQGVTLSRKTGEAPATFDPKVHAEMLQMACGTAATK